MDASSSSWVTRSPSQGLCSSWRWSNKCGYRVAGRCSDVVRRVCASSQLLPATKSSIDQDFLHILDAFDSEDSEQQQANVARFEEEGKRNGNESRKINLDEVMNCLNGTKTEEDLDKAMQKWKGKISIRLMVTILNRQSDWERALALHDWMMEKGGFMPSVFAYNVVIRVALKNKQWNLVIGLVTEMMIQKRLKADKFTFSTLISGFSKAGLFKEALRWLEMMEENEIQPDVVIYSSLIDLACKLKNYSKGIHLISKMRSAGIHPDIVLFNSALNLYAKAKLHSEAERLLREMKELGIEADTLSYTILISAYAECEKYKQAQEVYAEMKSKGLTVDLMTCNIMINVYGKLGMINDAETLFWNMKQVMGIQHNVVTYNTMIKVYEQANYLTEAINIYTYMLANQIVRPNIVTYNTIIHVYGIRMEHDKATRVVDMMQSHGVRPNAVTYSSLIALYGRCGRYDRASFLFNKLRQRRFPMDEILYQSMLMVYERSGLIAHASRLLKELKDTKNQADNDVAVRVLAKADKIEDATRLFFREENRAYAFEARTYCEMVRMYGRARRHEMAVHVYEGMKGGPDGGDGGGLKLDGDAAVVVMNAYGKMGYVEGAERVYLEMREGVVEDDEVHWKMMKVYGDGKRVEYAEMLFQCLKAEGNVGLRDLYLCMMRVYERNNRLNDASALFLELQLINSA